MNKAIKERISALMDGELSEFEARRVLEEIKEDPELRHYWSSLLVSRKGLKEQSLVLEGKDISQKIARELGYLSNEFKKEPRSNEKKSFTPLFYFAASGSVAVVVVLLSIANISISSDSNTLTNSFSDEVSQNIAQAIESPEAIKLLKKVVGGIDAKLEKLNSYPKGQIQANYRMPSNGKTFNVNLSPISSSYDPGSLRASKLVYLKTDKGLFILSISGDIPPEEKAQILRNASVRFNKIN